VSTYDWGTIYVVRPERDGGELDVVEAFEDKASSIQKAIDLWRLGGDASRGTAIQALLDRVYAQPDALMNAEQIDELIRLLDGLEESLVGSVVDRDWNVAADQLPELRSRTTSINLSEEGGHVATAGVGAAIGSVQGLRMILLEARARGLLVALE